MGTVVERWWRHSQIFHGLQWFSNWRKGAYILSANLTGLAALVLFLLLPILSNTQIGIFLVAIALFWFLIWLGDATNPSFSNWTAIHLPMGCYWLIASLATILSPARSQAIDGWIKLTLYFVAFLAFNRILRVKRYGWRSILVGGYLITCLYVCVYGLRQYIFGIEALATWVDTESELADATRIYSFLGNPNLMASYLLPAIPLATIGFLHWRRWGVKLLAAIIALVSLLCIFLTLSRGAMLGLAAGLLVLAIGLVYWWSDRLPRWSMPALVGSMAGLFVLAATAIPTVRIRLQSILAGREDSSNDFRLQVMTSVLKMVRDYPILGIGPGNQAFNKIYPFYQRPGYSALGAYSVPLEITVETGIIGLVCYGWLFLSVVWLGWRSLNYLRPQAVSDRVGAALSSSSPDDANLPTSAKTASTGDPADIWAAEDLELEQDQAIATNQDYIATPDHRSQQPDQQNYRNGIWLVAALSAIASLFVHALVDTVWYRPQVQLVWWLLIALITSFTPLLTRTQAKS
ncbi:inorganic carbon transporter [Thalassoporum mexicanum PCC 7367]|uniref:IctB family putative bicarbonate transporter n=1 Tax=Thalassoporum mexicanum TaxID=3457544 RepID=UPI00029FD6A5|nr:IctB family putative bicarbonate transporter [Pseudanabaena sp. PCC 7367]AFY69534.1 inorganic carbon transporter [Pseudanabaena sp. PCC 7367]